MTILLLKFLKRTSYSRKVTVRPLSQGVFIWRRANPLGRASPSNRAGFHFEFTWEKAIPPTRAGLFRACLYGGGPALLVGLASLPRPRVSVKFFVKIYFCLYERRASPPWRDLAVDYLGSRLGGLKIFHIIALKRAGPGLEGQASQSFVHTTKFCLFMCRL